nr:hypothetical protein [Janthinobacterium sp. Marseille]
MRTQTIQKIDILILKEIYEKKGKASTYLLYKKLKISMGDLLKVIFSLQTDGLLTIDADWLHITPNGIKQLLAVRTHNKVPKNHIPNQMKRPYQILPTDPYIPSCSRLDSKVFAE